MREHRNALLISSAIICVATAMPAAAQTKSFDIPAQSVQSAVNQLGRQAEIQIIAARSVTRGARSNPVRGSMTVEQALSVMLQGTGLTYRQTGAQTYTVVASARSAGEAAGQTASSTREGQAGTAAGDSEEDAGQEIVVTAQKREQRLQDVPLSIAVVTGNEIRRRGMVSAEDYLRGIPGVNQTGERTGAAITIRGIETSPSNQNFSSGTTVATYFGETPTTNSAGIGGGSNVDIKLVDIARVEVLRGPQGTSFGNSSLGGAVRVIPQAPRLDAVEGRVAGSYSRTSGTGGDNYDIQGMLNLPVITNKIALRAVAYQFEDSGFYRNVAGSNAAFQAAATAVGAQQIAVDQREVGKTRFSGLRISALIQPIEPLRLTLTYLTQATRVDGEPLANSGRYEQQILQVAPEHQYRNTSEGSLDTDIDLFNALVEYDFGWADLVATYSHIDSKSRNTYPFSAIFTPGFATPASIRDLSDHAEDSGEVRLVSKLDGQVNFVVGAYAEALDDHYFQDFYWNGDPVFSYVPGLRFLGSYDEDRDLTQKAAFGELTWEPLKGLTLTGGARAYEYKRTSKVDTAGLFFGDSSTTNSAKASGASFRANVSYKPNDDMLIYASWSQGFRLGKPQPGLPVGQCDLNNDGTVDGTSLSLASTRSVDSDKVNNYEIGFKLSALNRRLNISADVFQIDWSGVPVRSSVTCNGQSYAFNANAGEARSQGVEFQADIAITEASRIYFGGSYIDAKLTRDAPFLLPPASDGDRLPGSPRFNANVGGEVRVPISGRELSLRADAIYVGKFYGDLQQSAGTRAGDYVKIDAAARLALDPVAVELFVRNLTNADSFAFRGTAAVGDFFGYRLRPRTIGVRAELNF